MMTIQPPTLRLPSIAKIASFTTSQLLDSVQYLHLLYLPHVRGSRRRHPNRREDDEHEDVRCDAFERAYAIRWLTALIAQLEARTITQSPIDDTDTLIQQAASLLATCAGVAAAGKVQRRFTFESTLAGEIHVDLTDISLDNDDYGSVGAQTWGGACVLAEMIAEHPDRFGLAIHRSPPASSDSPPNQTRGRPLRILELGAGTGLVGLTIAKLLQALPPWKNTNTNHPRATIVLTDFYPAVLDNLRSNIGANFPTHPEDTDNAILINSHPLDWSLFPTTETPEILSSPFDIIFGADIVYEVQHAIWIHDCLKSLLSHPDGSGEDRLFHLVIPLRPTHAFESGTVEDVFGPKHRILDASQRDLTILFKESIFCEAHGDGRDGRSHTDDDVEYVYYQIGWTR